MMITSLVFINYVNDAVLMLISMNLHMKSSEVSIKTRSTLASFSFKGQATKHTTVKWSIVANRVAKIQSNGILSVGGIVQVRRILQTC